MIACAAALSLPAWASWPLDRGRDDTKTARTFVPRHPERQYAFEFTGQPIDSIKWQTATGQDVPGGQVGDLEGLNLSQAVTVANAVSRSNDLPLCYRLDGCSGDLSDPDYLCETIDPASISCKGFRLPIPTEIEIMERVSRDSQIAQWTHLGQLDDARGVRRTDESPESVAGMLLVRTVEFTEAGESSAE